VSLGFHPYRRARHGFDPYSRGLFFPSAGAFFRVIFPAFLHFQNYIQRCAIIFGSMKRFVWVKKVLGKGGRRVEKSSTGVARVRPVTARVRSLQPRVIFPFRRSVFPGYLPGIFALSKLHTKMRYHFWFYETFCLGEKSAWEGWETRRRVQHRCRPGTSGYGTGSKTYRRHTSWVRVPGSFPSSYKEQLPFPQKLHSTPKKPLA
jgi:hypothetical protein